MTDTRRDATPTSVPTPRAPEEPEEPEAQYPWSKPWHHARGGRPRSEFWDVETAGWRSRGPIPAPRKGHYN